MIKTKRNVGFSLDTNIHLNVDLLTIDEASLLVSKCLALEGVIEAKLPDAETYSIFDNSLDEYIRKEADYFKEKMILAIEKGSLKCQHLERDIDEIIITDESYVTFYNLTDWLETRGYGWGDWFEEYAQFILHLMDETTKLIAAEKAKRANKCKEPVKLSYEDLERKSLILEEENDTLKLALYESYIQQESPKPIAPKQTNSYLNVIGALLGLLLGKSSNGKPYSSFNSQQSIIDAIHANFGEQDGLSKRNLEDKFSLAKRNLTKEAED